MQSYCGLLLKEHLKETQERLERDCLEHPCKRSLKLCDSSSIQVILLLLTEGAGIVNVQSCGAKHIDACVRIMRHLQSFWKFADISRKVSTLICLNRCSENRIILRNSFFSNTDIHRFLYWYSNIYKLMNVCHVLSFDLITNWCWKQQRNAATNYIYAVFSKYFTQFF